MTEQQQHEIETIKKHMDAIHSLAKNIESFAFHSGAKPTENDAKLIQKLATKTINSARALS